MGFADLIEQHRVVVVVGSGGVGKTTTSAALALHAARSGRRVLCLTIDPARRLANSLGLERMTAHEQEVPPSLFEAQGLPCEGSLHAMMLDAKSTFDELVARYAPDEASRDRILGNRMYQYVSTSLAGVRDYMAMEKLHAVREGGWDLIVLDTPPTSNALDFLDAPEKMVGLIDSPATRWFVRAFKSTGRMSFDVLGKSAAYVLKGLARFTGAQFLDDISEFVTGFNDLFGGFKERAESVARDLRGPEVAFLVVTSPSPLALDEALFFDGRLAELGIRRHGFVINGVRPLRDEPDASPEALVAAAADALPDDVDARKAVRWMQRAFDDERVEALADQAQVDRLRAGSDARLRFVEVPAFERDVHSLSALAAVADHLVAPSSSADGAAEARP